MNRVKTGVAFLLLGGAAVVVYADCVPTPGQETCELTLDDGIDNDCNGLIDMEDPGCDSWFRPGDCNRDGRLEMSDAICLFGHLFLGSPSELPCAEPTDLRPGLTFLMDWNGDDQVDISDGVGMLNWLFKGGSAHFDGTRCRVVIDCESPCGD